MTAVQCVGCGRDAPESAKVCGYCGQQLRVPCSRCGEVIPASAKVCGNCGRPHMDAVHGSRWHKPLAMALIVVVLLAVGSGVVGYLLQRNGDDGGAAKRQNQSGGTSEAVESTAGRAAAEPDSPIANPNAWFGAWESTDGDGSYQWLRIGHSEALGEDVAIYYDERASAGPCAGNAVIGDAAVGDTSGDELVLDVQLWCAPGPAPPTPIELVEQGCEQVEIERCVLSQRANGWAWMYTDVHARMAFELIDPGDEVSSLRGPSGDELATVTWRASPATDLIVVRGADGKVVLR